MEQVPFSRLPVSAIFKTGEDTIGIRERPKTMLSPETKRTKMIAIVPPPTVLVYPEIIPIPSQKTIKALYNASIEEKEMSTTPMPSSRKSLESEHVEPSRKNKQCNKNYNNQLYLKPAGVLSLDQILLPALGLEEEYALKNIQAKIQRDSPEFKFVMENCRRLVRESIRRATLSVQSSRTKRTEHQQERRQQQLIEIQRARENRQRIREEEQDRQRKEQLRKKEILQAEKKRYRAREYPRNQELWKEIIFLTSSVAQLEREERMWMQIEQDIIQLVGKNNVLGTGKPELSRNNLEQQSEGNTSLLSSASASRVIFIKAQKDPFQTETEEKVRDIVLASARIQKGLGMVLELLDDSEVVRKELYEKYRRDHVFRGYQAVNNPRDMIRFLSQSQDDHV